MSICRSLWVVAVVLLTLSAGWSQDSSTQEPPGSTPQQPAPATGSDNPEASISENPPISGLDMPNLEPHAAPVSYLQPGAQVRESVDSNIANSLGGSSTQSISRVEGSLELRRLWRHYDLYLNYLGGVGYYNVHSIGLKQIQELGFEQKIVWKRGQLALRDAFSYQPEGTFGSAYGSVATTGAGLSGLGSFFSELALGELGQVSRIMNVSVVDAVQTLTPKSSITAMGAYAFVHFLQNNPATGSPSPGSTEIVGEVGYDRILGRHDHTALTYAYQGFHFSTGSDFHSNVFQLMWGHRISGRMNFLIGVGPQFTQINNLLVPAINPNSVGPGCKSVGSTIECPTNDLRISAAGRAYLHYQFPKWSLVLSYKHYLTAGSGFFLGAESDVARLTANHPLNRVWNVYTDVGYSRNSHVLPCPVGSPTCLGVSANTYQYGFAGFGVHRNFGHDFRAFASYQFTDLVFDSSLCGPTVRCNRNSQRQAGTIGLDWTPRPIRLD